MNGDIRTPGPQFRTPPGSFSSLDLVETEPMDPRLRLLLIALRRALLILADGIADYCGIEKR